MWDSLTADPKYATLPWGKEIHGARLLRIARIVDLEVKVIHMTLFNFTHAILPMHLTPFNSCRLEGVP